MSTPHPCPWLDPDVLEAEAKAEEIYYNNLTKNEIQSK